MTESNFSRISAKVKVSTRLEAEVELTASDIVRWMDACKDSSVLKQLARYANYCAMSLENQDNDDWRSRA